MTSTVFALVLALAATGQVASENRPGTIKADEIKYQKEMFKQWWGNDLVTKLDDLPSEGVVPKVRVPYSGHDYPDRNGGTADALYKYDQAFHRGRPLAAEYERMDVSAHRNGHGPDYRVGLFGRRIPTRNAVPGWYGHCNGWTAAAIRHAEPQKNVVRNGVTFTPADIKAILADVYMYSSTEFLGGVDEAINPATLHLTLGNWLGLGSHPIGMEAALGEVVINYPVYSYGTRVKKLSDDQAEVWTTIRYAMNTPREYNKSPNANRTMYFHYVLNLDDDGNVTGGRYMGDSGRIDMLWTPLKPIQGGKKGNERGNPHIDVAEALALWRESVPEDIRNQWLNVDPTEEDRILPAEPEQAEEKPASETTAKAEVSASESP